MINTRKLIALLVALIITPIVADISKTQLEASLPITDSKKQKSRKRKSSGIYPKNISYRSMSYEQLFAARAIRIKNKDILTAIKYTEQLIHLCDPHDVTTITQHLLEIADFFFELENFHKATQKYAEFSLLYPGHERIRYALYMAIKSSFNCTLSSNRDQTKTEETLALAITFLNDDHSTQYKEEVAAIAHQCRVKCLESELSICDFYIKRGNFKAAEKRATAMRNTLIHESPDLEPYIIALEGNIIVQKNIAQQKLEAKLSHKSNRRMTERF